MKLAIAILSIALVFRQENLDAAGTITQAVFHVAITGDNENPGTEDKPVATIKQARDLVRQLIASGLTSDVQVLIHGGTYYLSETLTLDHRDSGTKLHSITYAAYPGDKVTISGGRAITNWKQEDTGLWAVVIPEVVAGQWYFRDLYVNGRRAVRARKPKLDAKDPYYQLEESKLSSDLSSWEMKLHPGQVSNWKDLSDVEIVILRTYDITRKQLADVKIATGRFLLKPPHIIPSHHADFLPRGNERCYLENALAFLDQPGEWYLSRTTGELRYWPRAGEKLNQSEVIAPILSNLVIVKGSEKQPVQNLHFRGITFSHSTWSLPDVGFMGTQASLYSLPGPLEQRRYYERMDAGISFEFTDSCSVEDSEIDHMGGYGIELRRGCHKNLLQGNRIYDIGANGVMVGEPRESSDANAVTANKVVNNVVHDCGATYYGSVGVWAGMISDSLIAHNLVYDLPYSGISLGWVWGSNETDCKNNRVLYNHVHHVMKIMDDGGAIYTVGHQPGTILRGNVVHNTANTDNPKRGGYGIYNDAGGMTGFLVESNVIYAIATESPNSCGWSATADWRGDNMWRENLIMRNESFFPGIVGYSMLFDRDLYLDSDHNPKLEPANLTIECWVKFIELPTGRDPTVWLINKNTNEFTDGNYALAVSHSNVGAYLNIGGGREGCFAAWSGNNPIISNAWNHLAMTYDGHDLKVYCNGTLAGLSTVNRQRSTGSGVLRIGKRADDYNRTLHGLLDEVRIYNRALSSEEIKNYYAEVLAAKAQGSEVRGLESKDSIPSADCVVEWTFDDLKDRIEHATDAAGPVEPYRSRIAADETSKVTNKKEIQP